MAKKIVATPNPKLEKAIKAIGKKCKSELDRIAMASSRGQAVVSPYCPPPGK